MTPYNIKELTWEKWKRFYINEPLLRSSKGTLNSIRYAMNIFGIPSSMYYFAEMMRSGYGVDYDKAYRNNSKEFYLDKNIYGLNITKDKNLFFKSIDLTTIDKPSYKITNSVNSLCLYFSINWKLFFDLQFEEADTLDLFIASQSISTKDNPDCRFSIMKSADKYYWRLSYVSTWVGGFGTFSSDFVKEIDMASLHDGIYCLFINLYEDITYQYSFDLKLTHLNNYNELIYDWEEASLQADWDYQMWNFPDFTAGLMFGSNNTDYNNVYNLYGVKMFWTRPEDTDIISHSKNPKQYYTSGYEDNMCLYIDFDNPRNMSATSPHTKPENITKSQYPLILETLDWGNSGNAWEYEAYWPYNFVNNVTKVRLYSYSSMTLLGNKVIPIDRDATNLTLTKDPKLTYEYNIDKDMHLSSMFLLFSNSRNVDILISERYDTNYVKTSMIKPEDFYSGSYTTLNQERNRFFTSWNVKSLIMDSNIISNAIDPDIWSVIKKLSPARSEIVGGHYIAPHIFNRSKLKQIRSTVTLQDSSENQISFENLNSMAMSVNSSQLAVVPQTYSVDSVKCNTYEKDLYVNSENTIFTSVADNIFVENKIMGSDYSSILQIDEMPNYNQQRYEPSYYFSSSEAPLKKLKDYPGETLLTRKQIYDKAFNPYVGCKLTTDLAEGRPPVQIRVIKTNPIIKVDKKIGGSVNENKTIDITSESPINETKNITGGVKPAPDIKTPMTGVPKFIPSVDEENNEKKI